MTMRPEPYAHFVESEAVWRGLDGLAARAAQRGTSQAALALAWLLRDDRVTAVVVGPRRPEHLEPALTALGQPVTAAEHDELARLFAF
jgi:aryl-alcohol dehydrogenase-like predicted oxidoreductase